jgi:photosystem II stability/assembly factor-like uncharacterized protein
MKKNVLSILLAAALVATALPQTWRQLASGPSLTDFDSVTMVNELRGFAVGRYAALVRTDDGGQTWNKVPLAMHSDDPLYKVAFRDQNIGFLLGNVGGGVADIWRTTDGGTTWARVLSTSTGMEGSWRNIAFTGTSTVLIGANGGFARSTDNGTTWQVRSGWPSCPVIYGMAFRNAEHGVVGGNLPGTGIQGIFKTSDGGATWSLRHSVPANDVIWIGGNTYMAVAGQAVVRSDDDGNSWYNHGYVQGGLLRFQRITPTVFAGTDELGGVHMSTDGGVSWFRVRDQIFDIAKAWPLHFIDPQRGLVAGERGLMHRTLDGGASWQQVSNGVNMQIWDVHAFDESDMVAIGDIGLILNSSDGGVTWSMQRQKVTGVIWNRYEDLKSSDIHRPSNYVLAAGAGGVVFRSYDRGRTWQSVGYPAIPEFGIRVVDVVDQNVSHMIAGARPSPYFLRTTNGGTSWTWQLFSNSELYDVEFVDANTGYLLADDFTQFGNPRRGYYKTTNGGATWTFRQLPTSDHLVAIEFAGPNVGYVMAYGYLAKTIDGGNTWQTLPHGTGRDWSRLWLHSATEIYAAEHGYMNPEPKVWKSTDGGLTWSFDRSGTPPNNLDSVTTTPAGRLFVGGFQGGIHTNTAPATSIMPTAFTVESGGWVNGNLQSLASSDDYRLILDSNFANPIKIRFDSVSPSATASALTFTYEGQASAASLQTLELYDYVAGAWTVVDFRNATQMDSTVNVTVPNPARFVQAGTRKVSARASLSLQSRSVRYWQVKIDRVAWTITP